VPSDAVGYHRRVSTGAPGGGDRVRVLYLIDSTRGGGGAERIAVLVLEQLDPTRFDRAICITRHATEETIAELQRSGVEILPLARKSRFHISPWLRLVALGRRRRFDIVHAHKHGSNVWASLLKPVLRIPIFYAHEHSWPFEGNLKRLLLDRLLIARRATRVIAVSDADRDAMIRVTKIDPSRIEVLPNGIPDPIVEDVDAVRAELGLPAGAPVVTCVGARPEKRVERIIEAVGAVRPQHPDVQLLVVGGGIADQRTLDELVERLSLKGSVHFLGFRKDIATLLKLTDVGVIASDREGSPLAVLEYMAAGCGIVASRVGGIPDMVRHGQEGLLVEPGDVKGLGDAVRTLLDDPGLRKRLGAAAVARREAEFSLRTLVGRTEALYEEGLRQAGLATADAAPAESTA
jgi:glycosyltransferase involved in cell wall biosynthesis